EADVASLKYFRVTSGRIAGVPVDISRTGYTGDLGYEIWMPWEQAIDVWDALIAAGGPFDVRPAGMLALDVARIEAGLLLIEVDFFSSRKALIPSQQYSPFEMGLGRLVQADKGPFVGQAALRTEKAQGAPRQVVGLEINWEEVEVLYEKLEMPPQVPATASRVAVPVYRDGAQVGKATSTTWSPVLKKMIALATVERGSIDAGSRLEMEVTVEAVRHRAGAKVVPTPFFNPARKTSVHP
ncbi:MAG: aminomethyl transferase family protein, partial [Acidobacteria bacterium]